MNPDGKAIWMLLVIDLFIYLQVEDNAEPIKMYPGGKRLISDYSSPPAKRLQPEKLVILTLNLLVCCRHMHNCSIKKGNEIYHTGKTGSPQQ